MASQNDNNQLTFIETPDVNDPSDTKLTEPASNDYDELSQLSQDNEYDDESEESDSDWSDDDDDSGYVSNYDWINENSKYNFDWLMMMMMNIHPDGGIYNESGDDLSHIS